MIFRDVQDASFFHDDIVFAWWVRLRLLADVAYPEAGTFPRRIPDDVIARLVEGGHLAQVNSERFRDVALDAERDAQAALGRAGAEARWHRGPNGGPMGGPKGAHQIAMQTDTETETETYVESVSGVGKRARDDGRRTSKNGLRQVMG